MTFYANVLGSIMFCISDSETDIAGAARGANQSFIALVRDTTETFDLSPLLQLLTMDLLSEHITTRVAALQWINMLHEKTPRAMNEYIGDLLPALLRTLSDPAEEVILLNLQVIEIRTSQSKADHLNYFISIRFSLEYLWTKPTF